MRFVAGPMDVSFVMFLVMIGVALYDTVREQLPKVRLLHVLPGRAVSFSFTAARRVVSFCLTAARQFGFETRTTSDQPGHFF
jgi:hypothetical protein